MIEFASAFADGAANVLTWPNILIPVLGTLIAMTASFLPGIGNASLSALLILFTIGWSPVQVLLLFGALTGGATFMGSVTAILFNIPGNASSSASLLDGHPLSRLGYPKTAIASAATASAVGSVFGVCVLIAMLPIIRPLLLEFGPLERFLLGLWGLSTIIAIPNSSVSKGLAVTMLGLLASMIGSDATTGAPRWTFGGFALYDGFGTIALLLGFFTLSEIIGWRRSYSLGHAAKSADQGDSVRKGVLSVFQNFGLTLRSSTIGSVIGMIPGVGGTVAGFVAYGQAVMTSRDKSGFGRGEIRGLIAPEAAIDAKDGGSLLPALAFGLPGSEAGVILLAVFAIHGIVPGMSMLTVDLPLTFTLILALLFSNILTSVVGVALTPALARLTVLRIDRVALPVIVASLVTIVQLHGVLSDLYIAVGFALFGYLLRHFRWPRVPFIIAFILGEFIEKNLELTSQLVSVGRISVPERPVAIALVVLIGISLIWMARRIKRSGALPLKKRGEIWLTLSLAAAALVLAVQAQQGDDAYSDLAKVMSAATFLILLAIAGAQAIEMRQPRFARIPRRGIPRPHWMPIGLVAALPFAIALVGLPLATGALVWVWLVADYGRGLRRHLSLALISAASVLATALYLDRVANVYLPQPILAGLF